MMLIRSVAVARSSILFRRTTACRALATQVTTTTSTQQQRQNQQKANYALLAGAAALLGAVSAATVTLLDAPSKITPNSNEDQKDTSAIAKHLDNRPPPRPDLPTYTREQVAEHCEEDSLWFTYRGAVYDLTFFQHGHPGGAPRILMAAGQGECD